MEGAELVAKPPAQIIGRTRAARQLQIKDPNVSERHAELAWRDGAWRLRDLGSSNGTCVNGAELPRQGNACCTGAMRDRGASVGPTPGTHVVHGLGIGCGATSCAWPASPPLPCPHPRASPRRACPAGTKSLLPGEARTLQNGDVILFGEFSEVVVDITSAPDDGQTVAAYIQAEATRQEQRLRVRGLVGLPRHQACSPTCLRGLKPSPTLPRFAPSSALHQHLPPQAKAEQLENALRQDWHRHAQKLQAT